LSKIALPPCHPKGFSLSGDDDAENADEYRSDPHGPFRCG
jgi:hypothetical protein